MFVPESNLPFYPSGKQQSTTSRFKKFIKRNVVQFFRKNFGIKRIANSNMEEERENKVDSDSKIDLVTTLCSTAVKRRIIVNFTVSALKSINP